MNTENISENERSFYNALAEDMKMNEWEKPVPFEKEVHYQAFPSEHLPKVLSDYIKAVSEFIQVDSAMIALPMLSVLSLCLQGKATVAYPANDHTESINIYTLTIAPPGERKSGVFKALIRPVDEYVRQYNELHHKDIEEYKSKLQFLERRKQAAISSKKADFNRVLEITQELNELKPVHEMRLTCSDTTPEALASEIKKQGGCMAVMDDEGTVFDIISGLYNKGAGNINLLLKAYDGSPHTILRKTSDDITLDSPYLTIGIMTQPQQFFKAMNNKQFTGRGLMQRFLFAFPEGKSGRQNFSSKNIPSEVQTAYDKLILSLLKIPKENEPFRLEHDKESYNFFHDYHELLQSKMREGGMFENIKDYANKHFAKVLKIAGLLHMCEHKPEEPINGQTAINAIAIGLWAENMALKAYNCDAFEDEIIKNAKYILSRIKESEKTELPKRELKHLCRSIHNESDFNKTIELLEEMNYIRTEEIPTKGRPSFICSVNPYI